MNHRTAALVIYLLFIWGCSNTGILKQHMTSVELEKVQAVKVFVEEKDLNELSYKVIQKVETRLCSNFPLCLREHFHAGPTKARWFHRDEEGCSDRDLIDETVEQLKINAVGAGGNAITNLVCLKDFIFGCGWSMECTADAILLDIYDDDGTPIKNDGIIPK